MSSIRDEEDNESKDTIKQKAWIEFAASAMNHYLKVGADYHTRIKWSAEAADDMTKEFMKRFG